MNKGTSLSQAGQATAHQRDADKHAAAARVLDATTPVDVADTVRINCEVGQSLGDIATQPIGWILSEGQRDSVLKR